MEKLFNDSEVFMKSRPTKLTDEQSQIIWKKLAQEVFNCGWCDYEIDDIISDLNRLSKNDNGYEKAKSLESLSNACEYEIDSDFVEWLDRLHDDFKDELYNNIKQWVEAHSVKPKHELGSELIVKSFISTAKELAVGNKIYINGFREKVAEYCVSNVYRASSNYIIKYELIEENCELTEQ